MDIKNQWDELDEKSQPETNSESVPSYQENESTQTSSAADLAAKIYPTPATSTSSSTSIVAKHLAHPSEPTPDTSHKPRRFLVAYMTTVFSAITILYGVAGLGYVLIDHFLGIKKDTTSWFYFDMAPIYISIMATLIIFAIIYIVASRYVAKSASNDTIGLKDWRAYKVVYAFFSALLIVTGASVVAGLLYIPLAQLMIADDMQSNQILIQTLAGVHILIWIVLLIWQERLVKKARQSWLQGFIVVAGVVLVVVATGIFPVGSKTDERYDHRAESDLSTIESEISSYKSTHAQLPSSLNDIKLDQDSPIKGRLNNYTYTVKTTQKSISSIYEDYSDLFQSNSSTDEKQSVDTDTSALQKLLSQTPRIPTTQTVKTYELCATFRTDTTGKTNTDGAISALLGTNASSDSFTSHKSGNVCFKRQ